LALRATQRRDVLKAKSLVSLTPNFSWVAGDGLVMWNRFNVYLVERKTVETVNQA
jgi:hypothetical protein